MRSFSSKLLRFANGNNMAAFLVCKLSRFSSSFYCVSRRSFSARFYCSAKTDRQQEGQGASNASHKMEAVEKNPYFAKYADRIAAMQKNAPEELMARLEKVSKRARSNATACTADQLSAASKEFKATASNKRSYAHATRRPASHQRQRLLDDIMKVDLLRDKTAEEVSKIWQEYHQTQENMIAAVIPALSYSTEFERSQRLPTFVYPIPRDQGFEFVLAQFSFHECHFTSMINYQVHKEDAPECMTITHYPEFEAEKGVVLMRGEFDKDVLTATEALCLVNQMQLYYNSKPDSERFRLLETFNLNPNEFQHEDLIKQLQSL